MIRALLAGEEVSARGEIEVHRARVWSRPATPPPLLGAAVTAETAAWVAGWADGLATVAQPPALLKRTVDAYTDAGGRGPRVLQVHVALEDTEAAALEVAREQWRHSAISDVSLWDIEQPEDFDALAGDPTDDQLRQGALLADDAEELADRIAALAALGFDRVYLHGIGTDQIGLPRPRRARPLAAGPDGGAAVKITDTSDLWWKIGGHLLPRRRDVHGRRTTTASATSPASPGGSTTSPTSASRASGSCRSIRPPIATTATTSATSTAIDPRLGNHGDFVEVIRTAEDRGMRVIVDLVVNHTSDKHPWFVAARRSRTSPLPRLLRLARRAARRTQQPTVFPGEEASVWEYDERTEQYFQHVFYKHQPDLNVGQPARARRDRQDDRLLAGARRLGLPPRRGAVLHRAARTASTSATRTTSCAT